MEILSGVDGIGISKLDSVDVVRHEVVSKIIDAYDKYELKNFSGDKS